MFLEGLEGWLCLYLNQLVEVYTTHFYYLIVYESVQRVKGENSRE